MAKPRIGAKQTVVTECTHDTRSVWLAYGELNGLCNKNCVVTSSIGTNTGLWNLQAILGISLEDM